MKIKRKNRNKYQKQESKEKEQNEGCLLIAKAKFNNLESYPKVSEKFIKMAFQLSELAEQGNKITVVANDFVGTFSSDNYGSLPLFFFELDSSKRVVVTIRRFEDGPKEIKSGLPYKTVCSMILVHGDWIEIDEGTLKLSYLKDYRTGKSIELEPAILFSTPSEMFPDLLKDFDQNSLDSAASVD